MTKKAGLLSLSNIFLFLLVFFSLSAYADVISMQVVGLCDSTLYPVTDRNVAISTTDEAHGKISRIQYKTTDANGYIYLDQDLHGKLIRVYLAGNRSVDVDCGSLFTPTEAGQVILGVGASGGLCPSFCPKH